MKRRMTEIVNMTILFRMRVVIPPTAAKRPGLIFTKHSRREVEFVLL